MTGLGNLIGRNTKLFFKDKGIFFTAMITPLILLVLYATFLANVYRDSFVAAIPPVFQVPDDLLDGIVGGQLLSSLLSVSCITVSFCANMIMVQDKANGTIHDLTVTPVKSSVLALSYYISTSISTLIITLVAAGACFIYLGFVGWYLSIQDVLFILLDVFILTMFGTALSSLINHFLSSQGQISVVGSIVSAGYGFICGAYMPISSFSSTIQKIVVFLPGTYGTCLLRNHSLTGALEEMESLNLPAEVTNGLKEALDMNLDVFGHTVSIPVMYCILGGAVFLCLGGYILLHTFIKKKK